MAYLYSDHEFDNGDGGQTKEGKCIEIMEYRHGPSRPCGATWYSAVHPPDQFRHWCSTLEAGGDCMHFEQDDD